MRAAVDDVRDHRVLARVQERHHYRGGGRHAGAEAGAAGPALQGADTLFQRDHGGIAGARVRVPLRHVVFHRLLDVGGRLVDRSQDRSGHRVGGDSSVHFPRLELHEGNRLPGPIPRDADGSIRNGGMRVSNVRAREENTDVILPRSLRCGPSRRGGGCPPRARHQRGDEGDGGRPGHGCRGCAGLRGRRTRPAGDRRAFGLLREVLRRTARASAQPQRCRPSSGCTRVPRSTSSFVTTSRA